MRSGTLLVAAVLLLGGCLESKGRDSIDPMPPEGVDEPVAFLGACQAGILFQLIQYAETDPYLPPGFHPRDPQDFLQTPVAFGNAAFIVLVLDCAAPDGTVYESGTTGIFVEAPAVEGLAPSIFDFYEVERFGPVAAFEQPVASAGWRRLPGWVNFTLEPEPVPPETDVIAAVSDEQGQAYRFMGPVAGQVNVGDGLVRFWQETPGGIGYYEYDVDLETLVGSGLCEARPDTALARFAPTAIPGTDFRCPPAEPIVALFPGLMLNATTHFLPGVHAG